MNKKDLIKEVVIEVSSKWKLIVLKNNLFTLYYVKYKRFKMFGENGARHVMYYYTTLEGTMNKKDLIREIAIEIIAQNGYDNTKIQEIADKANIAVGTIYLYYKNKQDVFDYIFLYIMTKKIKLLNNLELNGSTPLNTIKLYLKFHIEQYENNPNVFKILKQDGIPFSKQSVNIRIKYNILLKRLENVTKQGQKIGEIKEIEASAIAYVLLNIMNIMNIMNIIDINFDRQINYEARKEALILLIINGIKK